MKLTDEQIWACNIDENGDARICVAHQNVLEFARAIEREIGFTKANFWIDRIKKAVSEEREACAVLCETECAQNDGITCAEEIRARG